MAGLIHDVVLGGDGCVYRWHSGASRATPARQKPSLRRAGILAGCVIGALMRRRRIELCTMLDAALGRDGDDQHGIL